LPRVCRSSQAQAGCVNQRSAARPIPEAETLTQAPPRCRDRVSRVQPGTCRRPAGGPPRLVADAGKPCSGLDPKRTVGGSSRCLSLRGSPGGLSLVMDTVGMVESGHLGGVAPIMGLPDLSPSRTYAAGPWRRGTARGARESFRGPGERSPSARVPRRMTWCSVPRGIQPCLAWHPRTGPPS